MSNFLQPRKLFPIALCFVSLYCPGQDRGPIHWSFGIESFIENEARVIMRAEIIPGWHLYSQFNDEDGPFSTRISFAENRACELVGKIKEEGRATRFHDTAFDTDVVWFSDIVTFSQRIKLHSPGVLIKGKVEFMACSKHLCLPVAEQPFQLEIDPFRQKP